MIKYKGLKSIIAFMLIACFALIGCSHDDADSPDALVPSVMIDDVVYYRSEEKIELVSSDVKESDYLGRITSSVPLSEWPTENKQANMPIVNAPYAAYDGGIIILVDDTWLLFVTRK